MYYKVKVFADAGCDAVIESESKRMSIYTRQPAQNNLANKDVLRLLANHLGLPKENLRIVAGHHAPHKTIEVVHV